MSTVERANPTPSGHCQPGAARLQAYTGHMFNLSNVGCYNPSSVLSSGSPSWHVHGEAIDQGCNWNDATQRARGDAYFDWMLAHKEELNLQQMIWGDRIYDVSYGGVRHYGGSDHYGHIHAALGHAVASNWNPSSGDVSASSTTPQEDDMTSDQANELAAALQIVKNLDDKVNWILDELIVGGYDNRSTSVSLVNKVDKVLANTTPK